MSFGLLPPPAVTSSGCRRVTWWGCPPMTSRGRWPHPCSSSFAPEPRRISATCSRCTCQIWRWFGTRSSVRGPSRGRKQHDDACQRQNPPVRLITTRLTRVAVGSRTFAPQCNLWNLLVIKPIPKMEMAYHVVSWSSNSQVFVNLPGLLPKPFLPHNSHGGEF